MQLLLKEKQIKQKNALLAQTMLRVAARLSVRLQMRTSEAKTALGLALHIHRVTWHTMTLPLP